MTSPILTYVPSSVTLIQPSLPAPSGMAKFLWPLMKLIIYDSDVMKCSGTGILGAYDQRSLVIMQYEKAHDTIAVPIASVEPMKFDDVRLLPLLFLLIDIDNQFPGFSGIIGCHLGTVTEENNQDEGEKKGRDQPYS